MTWSSQLPVKSWKLTLHAERGVPPIEFYLFRQLCARARRLINNFPGGRGLSFCFDATDVTSLYPPTSLLRLGSLNLLDTANLVSSPVAPSFISNPVFIQGGGVRLFTCIVAKVFQRDISFIRGGRVKLGPPPPVCTYTESKVSLTAAYCFDSSLNKGTIRVKNEAGMLNSSSESLPRKSSPPAFVSPLSRLHGSVKRINHRENRGI